MKPDSSYWASEVSFALSKFENKLHNVDPNKHLDIAIETIELLQKITNAYYLKEIEMSKKLRAMYQQWFISHIDSPDRDKHFANIKNCIKEDIEAGNLKKNSEHHIGLRDWFMSFEQSLPPIDTDKKEMDKFIQAAQLLLNAEEIQE